MSRISVGSDGGGSVDWGRPQASPTRRKIEKAISKASIAVLNTFVEDTKLEDVDHVPDHIKNFEDNYVFDPNARPHKDLIIEEANDRVGAVEYEGRYQVKKWWYFSFCIFSNVVGIFVTLFSLGKTDLFESFEPNYILTYCSAVFYVPTLIWLRVVFFPGRTESMWRKLVLNQRAWRRKVYSQQKRVFLGRDVDVVQESVEEAARRTIRENHKRAQSNQVVSSTISDKSSKQISKTSIGSSNFNRSIVSSPPLAPILQSSDSRKSMPGLSAIDKKQSKRISFQV